MMVHFIRPFWLLLLVPFLFYVIWVVYTEKAYNPWKKIVDPHLLAVLGQRIAGPSRRWFNFLLLLFFFTSIIALAGPSWKKTSVPVYRELASIMIVLDVSSNMEDTDLKPDRLVRAKFKIRDLIQVAHNLQLGLVVFTSEAFTVSPLSQDAHTLGALLDELSTKIMPVSGSDSGHGLREANKLLKQAAVKGGNILLLTASPPTTNSWDQARLIAEQGGHLNILGMLENNDRNKPLIARLQQLAQAGNGSYETFTATNMNDIEALLDGLHNKQIIQNSNNDVVYQWTDAGPWLCLFLVPIALLVLRENMRYEKN